MSSHYRGYRAGSLRLPDWDYAWQASYFITICTANKKPWFGKIRSGIMGLSEIGIIAHHEWERCTIIRPDMNLVLGAFIVMPDHFHAILHIGENMYNVNSVYVPQLATRKSILNRRNQFGPQKKT